MKHAPDPGLTTKAEELKGSRYQENHTLDASKATSQYGHDVACHQGGVPGSLALPSSSTQNVPTPGMSTMSDLFTLRVCSASPTLSTLLALLPIRALSIFQRSSALSKPSTVPGPLPCFAPLKSPKYLTLSRLSTFPDSVVACEDVKNGFQTAWTR